MSDNNKSLPFIVGVSLLFLVPIAAGGSVYYSLRDDAEETETTNQRNQDLFKGLPSEQNIKPIPVPPTETSGGTSMGDNSSQGIPTGKYSNPPTQIETFGTDNPNPRRLDDDNSVELNRLRQQDNRQIDYSRPAASNDFKDTEDNSLVNPLSDDSSLELPESEDSEPLSPVTEPLFGQPTTPFAN